MISTSPFNDLYLHLVFAVLDFVSPQVELMTSTGYSPQQSALFMSILSFSETGFRLLSGIFGDRLPCARILTLPVVCLISACNTFALTISTGTAVIVCYVCSKCRAMCVCVGGGRSHPGIRYRCVAGDVRTHHFITM